MNPVIRILLTLATTRLLPGSAACRCTWPSPDQSKRASDRLIRGG